MNKNILITMLLTLSGTSLLGLTRAQLVQQQMHNGSLHTPIYLNKNEIDKSTTKFDFLHGELCSSCAKKEFTEIQKLEYRKYIINIMQNAYDNYILFDSPNISFLWYSVGTLTKPVRYVCYYAAIQALKQELHELEQ